jgi:hypothetical protein
MHAARDNVHAEIVSGLIDAGAQLGARDQTGRTAYDYARDNAFLKDTEIPVRLREDLS